MHLVSFIISDNIIHFTKKATESLLTDTPIAVDVFFQLLDNAVISVLWGLLWGTFLNKMRILKQTYLKGDT
jgi:hypothetical protein